MDRQTGRETDGQTDGRKDRLTDESTDRQMDIREIESESERALLPSMLAHKEFVLVSSVHFRQMYRRTDR